MSAGQVITGVSASDTLTLSEQLLVWPAPSVARYVSVHGDPLILNTAPLPSADVAATLQPQLSAHTGVLYVTRAPHTPASFVRVTLAGHVMVGAWLSYTDTTNEQVEVSDDVSRARKSCVVLPRGKLDPTVNPCVSWSVTPGQLSFTVGKE